MTPPASCPNATLQGYSQNPDGTLNYNSPVWNCGGNLIYSDNTPVVQAQTDPCYGPCGQQSGGTLSGYDASGNPVCSCIGVPSATNLSLLGNNLLTPGGFNIGGIDTATLILIAVVVVVAVIALVLLV